MFVGKRGAASASVQKMFCLLWVAGVIREAQVPAGSRDFFGFLKLGRRTANISKVTKSQVFQVGSTKYVNLGINGLYQHESKL